MQVTNSIPTDNNPALKNDNNLIQKLLYGGSVTSSKEIGNFSNKLKH